jgi:signal transduction histidine kinase/DNA-binding response OmpR family regulator/streptogramin lyase
MIKIKNLTAVLVLISLLMCQSCFAATPMVNPGPVVRLIEQASGFSTADANNLMQDKSGFIWFTRHDGLFRFDGYSLKHFEKQTQTANGLPHNFVTDIVEDAQGFIWVSTHGGLSRFDPKTEQFTHFYTQPQIDNTLNHNKLNALALGHNSKLWVASDQGINLFDINTLTTQRLSPPLLTAATGAVTGIFEDSQQRLWFTSEAIGLYLYQPDSRQTTHFQKGSSQHSLYSDNIHEITQTPDGHIWIGTDEGLNRYEQDEGHFSRIVIPLKKHNANGRVRVQSIEQDTQGRVWIGSYYNGVSILHPGAATAIDVNQGSNAPDSLNELYVSSILQDSSGAIWFASTRKGLFKLSPKALLFEHFIASGNTYLEITALFSDAKDNLWLGTSDGLYLFDSSSHQFETVTGDIGIVMSIHQDNEGTLIINQGARGLFALSSQTQQLSPYSTKQNGEAFALPDNLETIAIDSHNLLWGGLRMTPSNKAVGLFSYDKRTGSYVSHTDKFSVNDILVLQKHVIVSTDDKGLHIMDRLTGLWSAIEDTTQDISTVWCLFEDAQQRVWISFNNAGLAQLDLTSKTLTFYTEQQGLPTSDVRTIEQDNQGALWLGTSKGLVRFVPSNTEVTTFDYSDGLRIDTLWQKRSTGTTSGDIIMANTQSFVRFSGQHFLSTQPQTQAQTQDRPEYPILLSDFKLFNQEVALASIDSSSPLSVIINETELLVLSHQQYWFSLAVASTNYNGMDNIRYSYKVEGLNDRWNELGAGQRVVSFTSLPTGSYDLKVRASHPDGDWQTSQRSLKITILAPWWWSKVARVVYLVLSFCGIYLLIHLRTKSLVKQASRLEANVASRTVELKQSRDQVSSLLSQKERMFANISHEFKTPLTLILTPLENLINNPSTEQSAKLSMVGRNGQRLLRLIDQFLVLAKQQSDDVLALQQYSLNALLAELIASFKPLAQNKNQSLGCQPFPAVTLELTVDSLEMILTNLISNAIKYTPDNGTIDIVVTTTGQTVVIAVKDNGTGISAQNQPLVFNRFTRVDEPGDSDVSGAGIGLALVKELVENQGGTITLKSELNIGSTFAVTLPLNEVQNALAKSDVQKGPDQSVGKLIDSTQYEIGALLAAQRQEVSLVQDALLVQEQPEDGALPSVLLIDDNADMLVLLKNTLQGRYQCLSAGDGEKGLELAKNQLPDLIISDVMMPGIDGYQVVTLLKQDDLTSHIPVMLLSAKGDMQSRIKGWQQQADEFLQKPFNTTELLTRIENLLSIRTLLRQRYQHQFTTPVATKDRETIVEDSAHQKFLTKINEVLQKHYSDENFGAAILAKELAMSYRQLSRKMKAILDMTAVDVIRSYRLNKAAEQLTSGTPVSNVAHDVGFTTHSYFSQCFKAHFNCLPSQYAEQGK